MHSNIRMSARQEQPLRIAVSELPMVAWFATFVVGRFSISTSAILAPPMQSQSTWTHFASEAFHHSRRCWQVSSHGRLCNTKGVISNGSLQADGYKAVQICRQKWLVHRIVKITFHGLPKNQEAWQVHHVDGNKGNNCLDNLEYVTPSENNRHSFSCPSRRSSGPAQSKPVLWRPVGSMSWRTNPSAAALAEQLGMCKYTVAKRCRKESSAKGYEFRYQDQDLSVLALPGEEWRPMVDPRSGEQVSGRMVSSFGRIRSQTGLIGKGTLTAEGYYRTAVKGGLCYRNVYVHRLIAFVFVGPPASVHQTCVNHKDLDKGNNAVENLEWVSPAENQVHFYASSTPGRGTTVKAVWSRLHGTDDEWRWHRSMASAARELGLEPKYISNCTRGLQRKTGGFEFRLADTPAETSFSLPGEEWRQINKLLLQRDRELRGLC